MAKCELRPERGDAALEIFDLSDKEVVFENKEHDFRQTIGYSLGPDDTVLDCIEGPCPSGATKRIEFPYKRVNP